jgi:hypothetical protein
MQAAVNIEKRSIACRVEFESFIFRFSWNLMGTLWNGPLPDVIPVFLRVFPG